jgi:hypothetical protein
VRLALDPGKTTGVAYRGTDGFLRGLQWPGDDITAVLTGLHLHFVLTEIVVENFRSRPGGPAVNLSAPMTIGRIFEWAEEADVPVILQDPSWAKRKVTNDALRSAGGWVRGQEHARDALRHLLYREHRRGEIDLAELDPVNVGG